MRPKLLRFPSRLTALVPAIVLGLIGPSTAEAAPVASFSFSPAAPLTGGNVTFKSTSTGFVAPQRWDLDGDGTCDDATGSTVQQSFAVAGTYTIKLCITDGVDEATATRKVTVNNRPPIAGFNFAPAAPFADDTIVLTSTSSDADGPIMGLDWDLDNDGGFDDGSGASASLAFPAPGSYTVRLLVTDRDGATAVAALAIPVAKRPPKLFAFSPIVRIIATFRRSGTRVRSLNVTAPEGSQVTVRCHGRGCSFRRLTRVAGARASGAAPRAQASALIKVRRLRRRLLRPRAVLSVRITKADTIGKYTRFRIRRGKAPRRTDRCLPPDSARPVRCPGA